MRPLLKYYEKAQKALARKQIRNGVRELQKVVKGGQNQKKFKDGVPDIALKAQAELDRLKSQALKTLEAVRAKIATGEQEALDSKKALNRLMRQYGGIADVREQVKVTLQELDG